MRGCQRFAEVAVGNSRQRVDLPFIDLRWAIAPAVFPSEPSSRLILVQEWRVRTSHARVLWRAFCSGRRVSRKARVSPVSGRPLLCCSARNPAIADTPLPFVDTGL